MMLRTLVLKNVGLYAEENEISLSTSVERPIVLIMGKNGAGKSTIQKSIRLCLYGKSALGPRVSESEYQRYLDSIAHKSDAGVVDEFSVGLEFDNYRSGRSDRYRVLRSWKKRSKDWIETLNVFENERPLSEIDLEHWQSFVNELVPPGISDLFFFDGEEIQRLADDDGGNSNLRSAIGRLLGLDLVDQLENDLAVYVGKLQLKSDESQVELERLLERSQTLSNEIREKSQLAAQKFAEIRQVAGQIEDTELEFERLGGAYAQSRNQIEAELAQARSQLDYILAEVRRACGDSMPFLLVASLIERTRLQIQKENRNRSIKQAASAIIQERNVLVERLAKQYSEADVATFVEEVIKVLLSRTDGSVAEVHRMTSRPEQVGLVHEGLARWSVWLSERLEEMRELQERVYVAERSLARAPDEKTLEPIFRRLSSLQATLTKLEMERSKILEQIEELERERSQVERQISRIKASLRERKSTERRAELATKVLAVFASHKKKLVDLKMRQLESALLEKFGVLLWKENRFTGCHIDRETFEPYLLEGRRVVPKSELSAGEKQLFATALLWSLVSVSGRRVPLVIDTPLARLDRIHRSKVAGIFFPRVSHQTVILATDTEVTEEVRKAMEHAIAKEYSLEFSQRLRRTTINETHVDGRV